MQSQVVSAKYRCKNRSYNQVSIHILYILMVIFGILHEKYTLKKILILLRQINVLFSEKTGKLKINTLSDSV